MWTLGHFHILGCLSFGTSVLFLFVNADGRAGGVLQVKQDMSAIGESLNIVKAMLEEADA